MKRSKQELDQLISNPSERLDTELKQWIDPTSDHGKAKIVRGCIALRNNNGGYLIIGIKDDGTPDASPFSNVKDLFHADELQRLVGLYATPSFEIEVEFGELNGVEYPIIVVPSGVVSPVVSKKEIANPNDPHKPLLKVDTVYVRTTSSSLTVSSAPAKAVDFDRLTRICFDNREADIGGFVRRHLSNVDLSKLTGLIGSPPTPPTTIQRAIEFLDVGRSCFDAKRTKEHLDAPQFGTFDVAIVIDGEFERPASMKDFYRRLQLEKPRHSGWALWIGDCNSVYDTAYILNDAWESLTGAPPHLGNFDFWRAEPIGRFYHVRALRDDYQSQLGFVPQKYLDFSLHMSHVTEAVSIGSHFARAMGCDELKTKLGFACRWTGLEGRILYSWSDRDLSFVSPPAAQNEKVTSAVMALETPESAFTPVVEMLVAPLFELFGGTKFETSFIDQIVRKTLSYRY